jgi:hypothetical protein
VSILKTNVMTIEDGYISDSVASFGEILYRSPSLDSATGEEENNEGLNFRQLDSHQKV